MKFIITIILLSTLYLEPNSAKRIRCHNIGIDKCFENFFSIGKRPDATKLATTEDGLDHFCGGFNKTLECIYDFIKRCGTPLHKELWDLVTGQMQSRFRAFICDNGPKRQAYVRHGQCIYDNVIGVDDAIPCLNNYLLAFEHLTTDVDHDWRSTLCCAHKRKEICTDALAVEHCGSEAREYFELFFDQIHFGFFEMVCTNTDHLLPDSDQCRKALPNAGKRPRGLKSKSYISKLLFRFFPFNYVPKAKRAKYQTKLNQLN